MESTFAYSYKIAQDFYDYIKNYMMDKSTEPTTTTTTSSTTDIDDALQSQYKSCNDDSNDFKEDLEVKDENSHDQEQSQTAIETVNCDILEDVQDELLQSEELPRRPRTIHEKNMQNLKLLVGNSNNSECCNAAHNRCVAKPTCTGALGSSTRLPTVTSAPAMMAAMASLHQHNNHNLQPAAPSVFYPPPPRAAAHKLFYRPGVIEEHMEAMIQQQHHHQDGGQQEFYRADSPLLYTASTRSPCSYIVPVGSTMLNRASTCNSSLTNVALHREGSRRFRTGAQRKIRRRAILKNGDCNILQSRTAKHRLRFLQDIFTTLVDAQWRWTLIIFALSFLMSWLAFAVIWWLIMFTHGDLEPDHLPSVEDQEWQPCVSAIHDFTSCFLFSIETQHTIGYGVRTTSEQCPEAIFVMCMQSIVGVMIQAFMVGIVFAKMTRPKHRTQTLLFSRNAVICQRDGHLCLMFRVGDMRKSHIIGAGIRAQLIRPKTTKEGEVLNQYQTELTVNADGCDGDLFFIWPMTIVHKIDEDSPLYHLSASDILQDKFEIVVVLEGTIESTGQTTQARSSYVAAEVLWGHRFEPVVSYNKERQGYAVNYAKFDNTLPVDTPLCSGADLNEFYRLQDAESVDTADNWHADRSASSWYFDRAPSDSVVRSEHGLVTPSTIPRISVQQFVSSTSSSASSHLNFTIEKKNSFSRFDGFQEEDGADADVERDDDEECSLHSIQSHSGLKP